MKAAAEKAALAQTATAEQSQEETKTEEAAPTKVIETPAKEESSKVTAENVAQEVDNKVVECTILKEAQEPTPQKGSPAAPAEPVPVVEKKPFKAAPQEVKLLVKEHTTSLQEAIHLITPLFSLIPQAVTFMGPHPVFLQKSELNMQEA